MAPVSHLPIQTDKPNPLSTESALESLDSVRSCLQHCSFIAFVAILVFLLVLWIPAVRSLVCQDDEKDDKESDSFIGQQDHLDDEKAFLRVAINEYDAFIGQQDQ